MMKKPPYTPEEFHKYLKTIDIGEIGKVFKIANVERDIVNGEPVIVFYLVGQERGIILNRQMATELTEALGPHPLVEEFFRLH